MEELDSSRVYRSSGGTCLVSSEKLGAQALDLSLSSIFGVRTAIDAYYNYRLTGTQGHLNDLYRQREEAIAKLKAATKYDSTQELLEKYGGAPRRPSDSDNGKRKASGGRDKASKPVARTGIAPPATANIPGRNLPSTPSSPQNHSRQDLRQTPPLRTSTLPPGSPQLPPDSPNSLSEEFAPNAFSPTSPPPRLIAPSMAEYASDGPRWYDRIMDLVLGEDETQPKNRMVLICHNCRLVNGQAPPGTRSPEDVGKWRCSECGTMNGVESETSRIVRQAVRSSDGNAKQPKTVSYDGKDGSSIAEVEEHVDDAEQDMDSDDAPVQEENRLDEALTNTPPASSTRSRARRGKGN